MKETVFCDLLEEKYRALRKQSEACRSLIITAGVLSEPFIDALRVFEERKRELRKLVEERRKEYFPFLQDLLLSGGSDERIQRIFERFSSSTGDMTKKLRKAFAYIFRCREDQIALSAHDVLRGGKLFYPSHLYLDIHSLGSYIVSEGFAFPTYFRGNLELKNFFILPEKISFPKRITGNLVLENLNVLPEEFSFPETVGGQLKLPELIVLPENVVWPEHVGGGIHINGELKGHPSLRAVPDTVDVVWV